MIKKKEFQKNMDSLERRRWRIPVKFLDKQKQKREKNGWRKNVDEKWVSAISFSNTIFRIENETLLTNQKKIILF